MTELMTRPEKAKFWMTLPFKLVALLAMGCLIAGAAAKKRIERWWKRI